MDAAKRFSAKEQGLRLVKPDFDYRKDPKGCFFCAICQKSLVPGKPYRGIHVVDGGWDVLHPGDEDKYVSDGGDCGLHPIGNDCAKNLGREWTCSPFVWGQTAPEAGR